MLVGQNIFWLFVNSGQTFIIKNDYIIYFNIDLRWHKSAHTVVIKGMSRHNKLMM